VRPEYDLPILWRVGFPAAIRLITTCPQSKDVPREEYLTRVEQVSRWSDDAGAHGMLVYTDNSIADPWLVAQTALRATKSLAPLVAVQPLYMHPCTAAKMVATLALLHGRRIDVNMVAGGFRTDLISLGDDLEHDLRYDRLVEYAEVMRLALEANEPFSYQGSYFQVENARLRPSLPPELMPGFFVSGSSAGGLEAARRLGATAVKYPQPARHEPVPAADDELSIGIRVGVIARETDEQAWTDAVLRFPADRRGQITHRMAMSVTDSQWHRQLSARVDGADPSVDTYWLWPFQNYRTFCPYLVGSYERVGVELAAYLERGFRTFILDIPQSPDELGHAGMAFSSALQGAAL
jgi:alkanesulfonate monooxygenase